MQNLSFLRQKRNKNTIILCTGIFIGFFFSSLLYFLLGLLETEEPKQTRNWSRHLENEFIPLNVPLDEELQQNIYYLAHSYDLEFTLIMGLIQQESGFDENIISNTKDWGLMQINEINHEWLAETLQIKNFLNPYQNIQAGMYILADLFKKYKNPHAVLMAYNLGETGAKRLWEQNIYSTKYSKAILKNQKTFQAYLKKTKTTKDH